MNVKRLARQLYYKGKTNRVPSEEEEQELISRYNIPYKHAPAFDDAVNTAIKPVEHEQEPAYDRHALADVLDDFEDRFKVDLDNINPRMYIDLEKKETLVKDYLVAKINASEMSKIYKGTLANDIKDSESVNMMLATLYYRVGISEY